MKSKMFAFIFAVLMFAWPAYGNQFTISFNFPGREEGDIAFVNEVVSKIPLSKVDIDSSNNSYDDYLSVSKRYDKDNKLTGTSFRYGFDTLKLICTMDKSDELNYYVLETMALPQSEVKDIDVFEESWKRRHPDRIMRLFSVISFDKSDAYGFVILHHAKQ